MFLLVNSFWVSLWSYILHLFSLFSRYFFRFSVEKIVENGSDESDDHGVKREEEDKGFDQIEEKELPMLDSEVGNVCNANTTSKYQFFAGNSVCAFIEEPQTVNFTVHEMFVISPKQSLIEKVDSFVEGDFRGFSVDLNGNSVDHGDSEESQLIENGICGDLSGEEEVVERGETENSVSVSNTRCDDHFVVKNDCDDLLSIEEDVVDVEHGEVGMSVSELSRNDHLLVDNDHECDDFSTREEGETELSVSDLSRDDNLLVSNDHDCDDLSHREEGETEVFVSDLSRDDHLLVCNDHDCDDFLTREEEMVEHEIGEEPAVGDLSNEQQYASSISQADLSEKEEIISLVEENLEKVHVSDQVHSSLASSNDFWSAIHKYDCVLGDYDEFDSDSDSDSDESPSYKNTLKPETPLGVGDKRVDYDEYSSSSSSNSSFDRNNVHLDDVISMESEQVEADSSFIELEPHTCNSSVHTEQHILSDDEYSDSDEDELDQESSNLDDLRGIDSRESCEEGDVQMGNDVLLEQKELIRQMKKEMRQLKISGLPTILEESESPRVEDDLRPLRIDGRIGHKDRMDEIQIFYKRYFDKMRKLDILSQQTMYAIGLLHLKSQDQLALNKKVSVPVIKSLLAQNFWSHKLRKHEADPVQKLIRDLRRELELVYVGQVCLSWEILKWHYCKVEELEAQDPDGFRQYNQVAGEFQKFQVLLQRFTENEPFNQGPRVQLYLKSRCGNPNLLQVPLIKDDPRTEWREDGEGAISISMLKEVLGASMRSFWDFLHADKDEVHGISLMSLHGVHVDLQDPSDTDLVTEIRSSLQKKEKRLKDLVRSGNCLVRKFQKHQDQRLSHEMFLAQVELRLVSRVLSMSKLTTDQLLWCHKKMNKTNIIGRKVYIESSFLLFPC